MSPSKLPCYIPHFLGALLGLGCGVSDAGLADHPPSLADASTPLADGSMGAPFEPTVELPEELSGDIYWWCSLDAVDICAGPVYFLDEGEVIVEGDINLGTPEEVLAEQAEILAFLDDGTRPKAVLNTVPRYHWSDPDCIPSPAGLCRNGRIRYSFSGDMPNAQIRQVLRAVDTWNALSSITGLVWQFRPALRSRDSGVRFDYNATSTTCNSKRIGERRRRYDINLGAAGGCFFQSVIMHEMGHAMGLRHEQNREGASRWIKWFSRNRGGSNRFNLGEHILNRRWDEIGTYNAESIMQYSTTLFAQQTGQSSGVSFPHFLNRQTLSRFGVSVVSTPVGDVPWVTSFDTFWNNAIRLDHHGIDLDDVRVVDIDEDGVDDLLAELGPQLVWSTSGRSGWRPVMIGGQRVDGSVDDVRFGHFDDHPGLDALIIDGRVWSLVSSDPVRLVETRTRDFRIHDAEVWDQRRSLIAVRRDRHWVVTAPGDVLGDVRVVTANEMGVEDIEVALRRVTATNDYFVAAFVDGALSRVLLDPSGEPRGGWADFFPDGNPVMSGRRGLEDVHFVHVDSPRVANERVDLVTWAFDGDVADLPGGGTRPMLRGEPIFVPNLSTTSATAQALTIRSQSVAIPMPVGIDLEADMVVGHFDSSGLASFLTLGLIPVNPQIAASDWGAIMTRYGVGPELAYLTDRYPLREVGGCTAAVCVQNPPSIYATPLRQVQPDERIELEAGFMASTRIRSVEVELGRVRGDGSIDVLETRVDTPSRAAAKIRDVFSRRDPGTYRVQMRPLDPVPAATRDVAQWFFNVVGGSCGDGFRDLSEACDDGAGNSDVDPDACRTDCTLATCGDGVIDSAEECDDALGNSDTVKDACRTDCSAARCGDGVADTSEACDDGAMNSDLPDASCRTSCELLSCGDGVWDMGAGEECDEGPLNSSEPNATCRPTCELRSCGDGVNDRGEQCDDGNTIDTDFCRNDCTLNLGDGGGGCAPLCDPI